jgi:hypothetical protein
MVHLTTATASPKRCGFIGFTVSLNPPPARFRAEKQAGAYFVTIGDGAAAGAAGDRAKVSHAFQPSGRSCAAISQ